MGIGALVLALAGCQSLDVHVWNLRQVHTPEGRPRGRGDLRGPLEHALHQVLDGSELQGGMRVLNDSKDERIEDPLGVCHENLNQLAEADRNDPHARAVLVQMITWLIGDCSYALTRERCAIELADLGARYGAHAPRAAPGTEDGADGTGGAATPEQLAGVVAELIHRTRELDDGGDAETLEAACDAARALELDRAGVQRMVAVTDLLLDRYGFDAAKFGALRGLHDELCRESIELALGAGVADAEPWVRAAAVRSWLELTRYPRKDRSAEAAVAEATDALTAALSDRHPLIVVEGVRALATYGVPAGSGSSAEVAAAEMFWMKALASLLGRRVEGPLHVAACDAMARLSGEERNLRAEYWTRRWLEIEAAARPGSPSAGGGTP